MKIYQRAYRLTVGGITIEDLDIEFKISKSLNKEPNTCDIKVYGLNEENRKHLNHLKNEPVKLEAGYVDAMPVIWLGEARNILTAREDAEWITLITSAELENIQSKKRIKETYAAGTPVITAFKDLAAAMGKTLGTSVAKIASDTRIGAGETFLHGTVLSGNARDQMDRLCLMMGYTWSAQDGVLQILDIGGSLSQTAVVLDSDSGLIGSPVVDADGDVKCQALIMPGLICGRKVQVEGLLVEKGTWIIWKCEYLGQTWGQDWYCSIFGKSLRGAGQ